jgi:type VI secretion system protein ImpB
MGDSIQDKLGRVRKPREHITYDVETEGSTEKKELPFVMGVVADLSGNAPSGEVRSYKERKFVSIDRDNFDEVMSSMKPGVQTRVPNKLAEDGSDISVKLEFGKMDDFEPAAVVRQVEPLRKLLEARNKLSDLLGKVDANEDLEETLEQILENTDNVTSLASELGLSTDSGDDSNG